MAKMFYTTQEAAQQLGVDENGLREMVQNGQLQQFRDGEKLMFKRDQVDALAGHGSGDGGGEAAGPSPADTGQGDAVDLGTEGGGQGDQSGATAIPLADTGGGSQAGEDSMGPGSSQSGQDVYQSGEVQAADPGAQTSVSDSSQGGQQSSDSGEAQLETAGSGSGLLDLTRESDDTSLGAELLDEIYPGSEGEQQQGGQRPAQPGDTGGGSQAPGASQSMGASQAPGLSQGPEASQATGAGQAAGGSQAAEGSQTPGGTGGGSGGGSAMLEESGESQAAPQEESFGGGAAIEQPAETPAAAQRTGPVQYAGEPSDPAGGGMGVGFMLGTTLVLAIGLLVAIAAIAGGQSALVGLMTATGMQFALWMGGLLVLCIIFGLVGMAIGNAASSPGRR